MFARRGRVCWVGGRCGRLGASMAYNGHYQNGARYGEHGEVETGPFELQLNPGPEPSHDALSGFVPSSEAFAAWYETEMCGLHALNVDNNRRVAVLCFPTRNARDVVEIMSRFRRPRKEGRKELARGVKAGGARLGRAPPPSAGRGRRWGARVFRA